MPPADTGQGHRARKTRSRPVPRRRTPAPVPPGPRGLFRGLSPCSGRPDPSHGNGTAVRSVRPPRHPVGKAQARSEREFLETENQALFLLLFLIQALYRRHVSLAIRDGRCTETPSGKERGRTPGGHPQTPAGPSSSRPRVLSLPGRSKSNATPKERPQCSFVGCVTWGGAEKPARRAPAQEPSPEPEPPRRPATLPAGRGETGARPPPAVPGVLCDRTAASSRHAQGALCPGRARFGGRTRQCPRGGGWGGRSHAAGPPAVLAALLPAGRARARGPPSSSEFPHH